MYCGNCGEKLTDGAIFCAKCGMKTASPNIPANLKNTDEIQQTTPVSHTQGQKRNIVNVRGGVYTGTKWFIKIPYKRYETDVDFCDDCVSFIQGSGFWNINNKFKTQIPYSEIIEVKTYKKYSIPNIILAICAVILAFPMHSWMHFIIAAVAIWIGKTAVVCINSANGNYFVPTEFMSDADELKEKITTALSQARKE